MGDLRRTFCFLSEILDLKAQPNERMVARNNMEHNTDKQINENTQQNIIVTGEVKGTNATMRKFQFLDASSTD